MEVSSLFSRASPLAPIPILTARNPLKANPNRPIPFVKIPSWISPAAPTRVTLRVSAARAHFPRRRNALRDKLAKDAQVRSPPESQSQDSNPKASEPSPDSAALWDRLERWADSELSRAAAGPAGSEEIFESVVVESEKAVSVGEPRWVPLRAGPAAELFSKAGLAALCGGCVFWAAAKLFGGDARAGLTREEEAMLRRKKNSRMGREELAKGSVEVVMDEPQVEVGRRPQLDREELMKSVVQATMPRDSSAVSDSSRYGSKDPDFDAKVREIREMARRARELELQERSQIDDQAKEDDFPSMLLAAKDRKLHSEAELMKRWLEDGNITDIDALPHNEKNMDYSVDLGNKGMPVGGNCVDDFNSTRNADSLKLPGINHHEITGKADEHKIDDRGYLRNPVVGVVDESTDYTSKANTSSAGVLRSEENFEENKAKCVVLQEAEPNESSSDTLDKVSQRTKPRVITSVKEAKQYLAKKRGMPKKVKPDKKVTVKMASSHLNTRRSTHDGKSDNKMNRTGVEGDKAVEPSKVQKPKAPKVASVASVPYGGKDSSSILKRSNSDNVSETKPLQDHTVRSNFSIKNNVAEVLGERSRDSRCDTPNGEPVESTSMSGLVHPLISGDLKEGKTVSLGKILHAVDVKNIASRGISQTSRMEILENEQKITNVQTGKDSCNFDINNNRLALESRKTCSDQSPLYGCSAGKTLEVIDSSKESTSKKVTTYGDCSPSSPLETGIPGTDKVDDMDDLSKMGKGSSKNSDGIECDTKVKPVIAEKSWVENNFQEFDPILKKIGAGFKDNYMVAKEKAQEMSSLSSEISELGLMKEDEELEWMNDERLRNIVLKVRDNELAGLDPFHSMDADDKQAFFQGLEKKAEKVNENLLGVHEWIHSRIENLDYGADGISLDDPLDKIVPRWKGPVIDKDPEYVRKCFATENSQDKLQIVDELPNYNAISPSPSVDQENSSSERELNSPKTLIECSDGSSRAGKKTGKEHWQHTKKWSQGFLDVYNSETDPEIKSIMKDMGKDLDRWITQKEIQDAADLMTRIPKRKRRYIERKMDKLKREMELYGQQAVVSKYKEYSDEPEDDHLWWLDLSCVLCIELYTIEDGIQKVGFYSLEMAADLELDPKQYHVIAFENPGDAKNFCYIVQAHLEMLGSGNAFVVPRNPKDAFREAKANGFNVTAIRKGELKLNIDQTLEEVDEEIVEIGSKMYHDKIMRERAVDMRSLMKGVICSDKSTKRKSKRMLSRSAES